MKPGAADPVRRGRSFCLFPFPFVLPPEAGRVGAAAVGRGAAAVAGGGPPAEPVPAVPGRLAGRRREGVQRPDRQAGRGELGQRGIGYDAAELAAAIRSALGIDRTWRAVLVGVGNLARALLRYQGFRARGFEVVGLFDTDPEKVRSVVEGLAVEPLDRLAERVPALRAELAVLTVPAEAAQPVADLLVGAGIRGVLNFAPVLLRLPPRVRLVTVDLTIQLEQLAFLVQRDAAGE